MKTQSFKSFASAIALVVLVSPFLHAGVIPGRWEKLDAQPSGKQIVVTLKTGDRMECAFKESGNDELTVVTSTGNEMTIAKSEVLRISSLEKHDDPATNGTLIGLAAGFAVGIAVIAGEEDFTVLGRLVFGGLGAAIGSLVGYAADKAHKGTEVLYQARELGTRSWTGQGDPQAPATIGDEGGQA